ncbi:hypothetical protein BOX15_Mlig026264g1 [Macrostomum lignano]|uniref:Uncharacterized protein n=2 Tax=Macrostomum lignano TaxID=282301 RepID=A0A267DC56_9PLAT|nr:hypothetical protein BOX15_Mlig026264g1 [Macrostomum lignano]
MSTSDNQSVKTATAFVITDVTDTTNCNGNDTEDAQMHDATTTQVVEAETVGTATTALPDRLRKRLLSERKCRPTNEQLDQKLARAEQRRQKQFAKRAASAREAEARCRRVAEAMETLHARRPQSRAEVVQRYVRLRHDLQEVLGRFNSEVERTNCALFAGPPLLAFGGGLGYSPSTSSRTSTSTTAATASAPTATTSTSSSWQHRPATAFVVGQTNGNDAPAAAASAADASISVEMPARLRQRLAAYPRRRGRHELKMALEKKLADAQRRKERYEQRRAESIKETEERCRRISETMEEISLQAPGPENQSEPQQPQEQPQEQRPEQQQTGNGEVCSSAGSRVFYRRVAKLQVDLDCLFTKFNREIVTVRGRPVDLLETLEWPPKPPPPQQQQPEVEQQKQQQQQKQQNRIACQTDDQICNNCGQDPNASRMA